MVRKRIGRRKGRATKGFFFRDGRGWFTKDQGKFVPLTDSQGEKLKDPDLPEAVVKQAYAEFLVQVAELRKAVPKVPESAEDDQVGAVCGKYLEHLRAEAGEIGPYPKGKAKTYVDRGETLFDFCYGIPAEFFCGGDLQRRKKKGTPPRLHPGYGQKLCSELTPAHVDEWLKAHKWSPGGWRTRVQAVKRAFNFGVERKMISASPIRGYKLPKSQARITYLTPEQEAALIAAATPAFGLALKVCIRTGARFGCEFAALHARHVRDFGDKMEWVFKAEESKTKKLRTIRVTDPEVMQAVRDGKKTGPIFRNDAGTPWERRMLSQNFRRAKQRIAKRGIHLDADACMYSCRHTYAKRTLEGFWTGKPASIKTLARLMGNTVQVCIDHYLQFSDADNEMLWGSA